MTTPRDLDRLAKAVKPRRLQLHPSRLAAAKAAGVSKDTWQRVEEGDPVREVSYAKVDQALGWAVGSCTSIAEGGEPVAVEHLGADDGTMISAIPASWLEKELPGVIESSAMETTPGLTVREIHALSDQVMEKLRRLGIRPNHM